MFSLSAALVAAALFGVGTILEATAARRSTASDTLDPRLLLRLFGQWAFLASIVVGGLGVVATTVALRHLPLFEVQAVVASSVGVSAVLAALIHHEPLDRRSRRALVAIVAGITMLASSSGSDKAPVTSTGFRWAILAVALACLALATLAGRRPNRSALDVGLLGGAAGLLYGVGNVGLRVLDRFTPGDLLSDPAAYAAAVGGVGGVLVLSTALQRGSVAIASGAMTVTETTLPAAIGLVLLSERPRSGWAAVAVVGFALAVAGAVVLCRTVPEVLAEPDPGSSSPGAVDVPEGDAVP